MSENVGASTPHNNPMGIHGLSRDSFTLKHNTLEKQSRIVKKGWPSGMISGGLFDKPSPQNQNITRFYTGNQHEIIPLIKIYLRE
jgi:hypothetical protein